MTTSASRLVSRSIRIGVSADAWFKLTLASAYTIFIVPLAAWLEAPMWLTGLTALLIAISAVAELATNRTRARIHVVYLAGYDVVWIMVSIVASVMALRGVDGAGSTWLAVQVVASVCLTVLFLATPHVAAPSARLRRR